jgi:hypothetical protein
MSNEPVVTIKATIFFDKRFWIGLFERIDKEGYRVARHVFGAEPSDREVYEFVLHNYKELKFGAPKEFKLQIKRMNPKRVQREIRREMQRIKETTRPCTFAHDYMRQEIEGKKVQKKHELSVEKQEDEERRFTLRQQKKKEKHRGH